MSGLEDFVSSDLPPPPVAMVAGARLTRGSRVRLRPRSQGDVFDLALAGRIARVERIDQDMEESIHVAVVLEDDPGADLGEALFPAHRFFFGLDEVEPVPDGSAEPSTTPTVLVAGIGNIFLGDDGFGVEVTRRLSAAGVPGSARLVDFGIRGMDLLYALQDEYQAVIFIDTAARGEPPGTLSVIEPDVSDQVPVIETHRMDPARVLRLAAEMGPVPARAVVVACEPGEIIDDPGDDEMAMGLSDAVAAAVDRAAELVGDLIERLTGDPGCDLGGEA